MEQQHNLHKKAHEFGSQNFATGSLNRPDALDNFQSLLSVEEMLYDGGRTRTAVRTAEIGRSLRLEEQRGARMSVMARVAQAYCEAVLSGENLTVAMDLVRSAEADLRRAADVRTSGMSTDADVLAIRVHLAAMREQQIRRSYELHTALGALNEAVGMPLATVVSLSSSLAGPLNDMQAGKGTREQRPEAREARLSADLSDLRAASVRAAYRPEAALRFAWEVDAQQVVLKAGANWMASVTLRWNLFNGFADRAAVREAALEQARSRSHEREVNAGIELQVRRASNALKGARERVVVEEASVAMAEENLRIVRNRYESGLTTVTELLRSEVAVAEVRTRRLAAVADVRLAAVAIDLSEGTLAPGSAGLR